LATTIHEIGGRSIGRLPNVGDAKATLHMVAIKDSRRTI
jgi:hypothetical protein